MRRVLSYPPRHDYVDRLHGAAARLVHRDEPWPELPNYYDPRWLRGHRDDWDIVHMHFTWEQYAPDLVGAVLATHQEADKPIVWTAHDLRNPHTRGEEADAIYLEMLAERADRVLTLTVGAAGEIARRFGRQAQVVPHGPLLDPDDAERWRSNIRAGRRGTTRALLHLRDVRANVDWRTPIRVVAELARGGVPIELSVLVAAEAGQRSEIEAAATDGVAVLPHGRLSLDELCGRLALADVLVLPYVWGTHSGMVELATDIGLSVIVGDVGYISEQAPCTTVPVSAGRLVADELGEALRAVVERSPDRVPLARRRRQLRTFRAIHAAVYRDLA